MIGRPPCAFTPRLRAQRTVATVSLRCSSRGDGRVLDVSCHIVSDLRRLGATVMCHARKLGPEAATLFAATLS